MANIVSTAFESEYGEYESHHGAAYYEMCSGTLKKNPHYPSVPPVRHLAAGSGRGKQRVVEGPLYSLVGNRDALAFLNIPGRVSHGFCCTAKRLGAGSRLCMLFLTSASTFSSVGVAGFHPLFKAREAGVDLRVRQPQFALVALAFPEPGGGWLCSMIASGIPISLCNIVNLGLDRDGRWAGYLRHCHRILCSTRACTRCGSKSRRPGGCRHLLRSRGRSSGCVP